MAVPDYKLSAVLCGHSLDVRCVAKTKEFCILSASRDRTAKLWHPEGLVFLSRYSAKILLKVNKTYLLQGKRLCERGDVQRA